MTWLQPRLIKVAIQGLGKVGFRILWIGTWIQNLWNQAMNKTSPHNNIYYYHLHAFLNYIKHIWPICNIVWKKNQIIQLSKLKLSDDLNYKRSFIFKIFLILYSPFENSTTRIAIVWIREVESEVMECFFTKKPFKNLLKILFWNYFSRDFRDFPELQLIM